MKPYSSTIKVMYPEMSTAKLTKNIDNNKTIFNKSCILVVKTRII